MVDILKEKVVKADGDCQMVVREMSDDSTEEILMNLLKDIITTKITQADGSYVILNSDDLKIEEHTTDGFVRKFNPENGKIKEEMTPEKIVTTFHDNGNIASIKNLLTGDVDEYYDDKKTALIRREDYEAYFDRKGNKNYEYKNGQLVVNPQWYSFYRLGIRTLDRENHWQENASLNPQKKTLVCLGGDQSKKAVDANGNIKGFLPVLGLSKAQQDEMQLVGCYRPFNMILQGIFAVRRIDDETRRKMLKSDYRREILQKFMPFMAKFVDGKYERLRNEELFENFGNIMIEAHCAGANDLMHFTKVFGEIMTKLGYSESTQKRAFRQIICITNNTQREMTDDLGFTCIHRYSITDGQFDPEYSTQFSRAYPAFLHDNKIFKERKGNRAAFIEVKPEEMIMAFDKILLNGTRKEEHNEGFWTTEKSDLTPVGKYQLHLMTNLGQFWYNNHGLVPGVRKLVEKISDDTKLKIFTEKALSLGDKLKKDKLNVLKNFRILESARNKFKYDKFDKTGVYKLLLQKERK